MTVSETHDCPRKLDRKFSELKFGRGDLDDLALPLGHVGGWEGGNDGIEIWKLWETLKIF